MFREMKGLDDKQKSIVLLSGGPDSATALAWAFEKGYAVNALHLNYGQINAERERVCAKKIANCFSVPIEVADISGLRDIFLDKIGDAIDYNIGCWETLPFMLGFPIALAVSYGLTLNAHTIILGVHHTDIEDHPEYRIEALKAIGNAVKIATSKEVDIIAPFAAQTKAEVIKFGYSVGVPYSMTWSCLLNGISHCGRCWGCARRKLAFKESHVLDPTDYEYKEIVEIQKIDVATMPSQRGLIFPELVTR